MTKISLKTQNIKTLERALAQGQDEIVRSVLNNMREQAYERKRAAARKYEEYKDTGTAAEMVARSSLDQYTKELELVKESARIIRKSLSDRQHVRVTNRINELNRIQRRNIQSQQAARRQKTTVFEMRHREKVDILFERLVLENPIYSGSESLREISNEVKNIIGFDVYSNIQAVFDVDRHFESGDEHELIFEVITGKFANRITESKNKISEKDYQKLTALYSELLNIFGG